MNAYKCIGFNLRWWWQFKFYTFSYFFFLHFACILSEHKVECVKYYATHTYYVYVIDQSTNQNKYQQQLHTNEKKKIGEIFKDN